MPAEVAGIALMAERLRLDESSADPASASLFYVIEQAKEGDSRAFEQLMTRFQKRVVGTAWHVLGNREDARDAAQEVFLKVYRHLKKFRAGEDFSAWLYRITVNVCRDLHRRRGPADKLASIECERELGILREPAATDDVEAAAMRSQEQAILTSALETLSTREREAIVLRDIEGLTSEDVARVLGSSAATVRSQICSARMKIKKYRDGVLNRRRRQ